MPRAKIIRRMIAGDFEDAVRDAELEGGVAKWETFRVVSTPEGLIYIVLAFFPKEIYLKKKGEENVRK